MAQAGKPEPQDMQGNCLEPDRRVDTNNDLGKSEPTLADMIYKCQNNAKPSRLVEDTFKQHVHLEYSDDKLLSLIIEKPKDYLTVTVWDNLIWKANIHGDDVLCVPRNHELILKLLSQGHETVGHFGSQHTDKYICQW